MCGVSGILHKHSTADGSLAAIGDQLIRMLEPMTHRGRDSSGVTIVGERPEGDFIVRIWTDSPREAADVLSRAEDTVRREGGVVCSSRHTGQFLRLAVNYEGEASDLAAALVDTPGVALHSLGHTSEVIKDVGTPRRHGRAARHRCHPGHPRHRPRAHGHPRAASTLTTPIHSGPTPSPTSPSYTTAS